MEDTTNLTRLGQLLIDLKTVSAVAPILFDDNAARVCGYRIATTGGVLEIKDAESSEAIRQQFYEP